MLPATAVSVTCPSLLGRAPPSERRRLNRFHSRDVRSARRAGEGVARRAPARATSVACCRAPRRRTRRTSGASTERISEPAGGRRQYPETGRSRRACASRPSAAISCSGPQPRLGARQDKQSCQRSRALLHGGLLSIPTRPPVGPVPFPERYDRGRVLSRRRARIRLGPRAGCSGPRFVAGSKAAAKAEQRHVGDQEKEANPGQEQQPKPARNAFRSGR
jgi:hypothetical protein